MNGSCVFQEERFMKHTSKAPFRNAESMLLI